MVDEDESLCLQFSLSLPLQDDLALDDEDGELLLLLLVLLGDLLYDELVLVLESLELLEDLEGLLGLSLLPLLTGLLSLLLSLLWTWMSGCLNSHSSPL